MIPDLKVVLVWRPCAEVTASLLTRWQQQRKRHLLIGPLGAAHLWRVYNRLACDYKEQHRADTLLFPLHWLVQNDRTALALINQRFGVVLEEVPIAAVVSADQLHRRPLSPMSWLSNVTGGRRVEERLKELSDQP